MTKYHFFFIAIILQNLIACYNSSNDELNFSDSKDISEYYEIVKTEADPVEAYKEAIMQLKIMHQNKTDIATVSYDSCINRALSNKINYLKNRMELNVIDHEFLNYLLIDSVNAVNNDSLWNFMRSENFNNLSKLVTIEDNKALANTSLAHLLKILDNRFTVLIHKQAKLLPRTNKPNYVLGGFFEGYALLYDLKNQQVICYFNYRINNTSNYKEFYMKNDKSIFDNMVLELDSVHRAKLVNLVAEQLNLQPFQVDLGFN